MREVGFSLHDYIEMCGQQNVKFIIVLIFLLSIQVIVNPLGHKRNFKHSGILKYGRTVNDFTLPLPLKAVYIYIWA